MWKRIGPVSQEGEDSGSQIMSDLALSMVGALLIAFTGYVLKFHSEITTTAEPGPPAAPTQPREKPELIGLNGPMTNVVYCLDLSGSMVGQAGKGIQTYTQSPEELSKRFLRVKEQLKRMVRQHEFVNFSVVGFGGFASGIESPRLVASTTTLVPGTPEARETACRELDAWQAVGGTPTLPVLKAIYELPGVEHIVLLTDGLPTVGGTQADVLEYVSGSGPARSRRAARGQSPSIVIDVIGIGDQSGQGDKESMALLAFTRRLADITGGFFQAW